jgi:hypothetical protein
VRPVSVNGNGKARAAAAAAAMRSRACPNSKIGASGLPLASEQKVRRLFRWSGFELPVPGHGKLCQTSILFVLSPGGADVAPSAIAFRAGDIAPNRGRLWADLTAPLEAAPR